MKLSIVTINKCLYKVVQKHSWLAQVVLWYYYMLLPINRKFCKELNCNVEKYIQSGLNVSRFQLRRAMLLSYIKEFFLPYEYRCFDFWDKDKQYRDNYISDEEVLNLFRRDKRVNKLPRNKYERYCLFKDLFKRDVIDIKFDGSKNEEEIYNDFCSKHAEAICKPVKGTKGNGIEKINLKSFSIHKLKDYFQGECMLEELIIQSEELAQFHPNSVNTIRFVTGLSPEGKFSFIYALFRNGCGGSVVDNVGAGGLIALINEKGVIETDGMKLGQYYEKHPDTGITYKGFQIPSWGELCTIAEKAHKTMPEQRLFGWDFAWTPNGWDLVEVNPAPAFVSYQILKKEGIRNRIKKAGLI